MKVVATAVEGAEIPAFQPYTLSIQADTPEEAEILNQFGKLNVTIPDHLRAGGHMTSAQARQFAGLQTKVATAHSTLQAELKAAHAASHKTSARRKKR